MYVAACICLLSLTFCSYLLSSCIPFLFFLFLSLSSPPVSLPLLLSSPLFATSLPFRSGYFSYVKDVNVDGLNLLQFGLPKDELISSNQDPGFFANGPDGVLNLTAVFPDNLPFFASKPHFLDADPGYRKNISGMHPDRSKHDSFLDVDPLTGN